MTGADELANYLEGRGHDVRKTRDGYRVACPVHEDPNPSCDFKDGERGIVVHCRAGCQTPDVVTAWDLSWPDLFYDAEGRRNGPEPPQREDVPTADQLTAAVQRLARDQARLQVLARMRGWHEPDVLRRMGVGCGLKPGRLTIATHDEHGALVGVSNIDPRPEAERNGALKNIAAGKRDLWPSPEDITADLLFLCEGEGDGITLATMGLPVICVPGASWWAGKRGQAAARRLARSDSRRTVFTLGDSDKPGRDWAHRAAVDLADVGVDVRVLDLAPSRGDGYDPSDLYRDCGFQPDKASRVVLDKAAQAERFKATTPRTAPTVGRAPWPKPMADDAFHGLAGEVVRAIQPVTEADPAAMLVQFLAVFGCAAGRTAYVVRDGRRHHAVLYVLVVGRTSRARKGTSWARVQEVMEPAAPSFLHERKARGLSSGEGLAYAVRDEVTQRIPKKGSGDADEDDELIIDPDAFTERLVDPGVEDKRLMVVEEEFAQPLRVMRREGNILSSNLRTLWDTGEAGAMTKNSPTVAHDAHVSVSGHIVSEELRRELTTTDMANGFGNRFIIVCAERAQRLAFGGAVDDARLDNFGARIASCLELASIAREVTMDPDAAQMWERAYHGELAVDFPGLVGAMTARAEAIVSRLALIYALLDKATIIRPVHLRAALAVWHFSVASTRHLFGGSTGDDKADRILAALDDAGLDGLAREQIRADVFRDKVSANRLDAALSLLVDCGLVSATKRETGGRPATIYQLADPGGDDA